MASSPETELPKETDIAVARTARKGSTVTQKQRWPSRRASAARKVGLGLPLAKGTKPVVKSAASRKARGKSPGAGGLQQLKEPTSSEADDKARDDAFCQGHIWLKTPGPDASFLDALKREPREMKDDSSSSEEQEGMSGEELAEVDNKGKDVEAVSTVVPPPEQLDEVCVEWAKKPFVMPPEDQMYTIRALNKKKEREDFKKNLSRSVTEKTTFASRAGNAAGSERLQKELKEMDRRMEDLMISLKYPLPVLPTTYRPRDKENMQEYVAKKREIFFVQMSLDTERAEIRKLEERTFQREEALRKSEEMLEEDRLEFDAFLKKNDEKVQEALKKAEKNTRLKQDKVLEIKKLNTEIGIVRAEVSKYEEQLEECTKYKEFLVKLTPSDWLEEQANLKAKRDAEPQNVAQGDAALADPEDEEEVTYFQHPHQLFEAYDAVEASNLVLLQQSQAIESTLESLKAKMREARAAKDAEINSLKSQLSVLQRQVKLEDEKQAALKRKGSINVEITTHEITLEMLETKVLASYLRCGLDPNPSLGPLQMLTMIEARMEEGMQLLRIIPQEFITTTEKAREKERRKKAREDNMAALAAVMEERRARSLERAKAPIFKRIGKPPMPRSFLPKRNRTGRGDKNLGDDAELAEFLARDY